jgi:hypothetical protein
LQIETTLPWERIVPDDPAAVRPDPTLEVRLGANVVLHEHLGDGIDAMFAGVVEHLRLGLVSNPKMLGGEVVVPGPQSSIEIKPIVKYSGPRSFDIPVHLTVRIAKGDTTIHRWSSDVKSLRTGHAEGRLAWTPPEDAEGTYRLDVELCLRGRMLLSRAIEFKLSLPPRP